MRVLIIDDDPEELELFQHAAGDLNEPIEFLDARDCAESLAIINAQAPGFIIIDLHLGPASGIDCLRQLRATPIAENLPIVMYSTSGSRHVIETCFKEKANYFFTKPNSIKEIGEILKKLIKVNWNSEMPVNRESFVINT